MAILELTAATMPAVFAVVPFTPPGTAPNQENFQPNVPSAQDIIRPIIKEAPSLKNYNAENNQVQKINVYMTILIQAQPIILTM
jgi:hypothetical protein